MQPLPSPHCAASPRMASLPNAPWSGRDLASASQTAPIATKRRKRETQLAGILAATSLVAARRPCIHIPPGRSRAPLTPQTWLGCRALNGDAAVWRAGLRLVFIVWGWGGEKESPRFPSADVERNSESLLCAQAARRAWWEIHVHTVQVHEILPSARAFLLLWLKAHFCFTKTSEAK